MRWPFSFWTDAKKDEASQTPSIVSSLSNNGPSQSTSTTHSSWSSPRLPTDWRHYTSPDVVLPATLLSAAFVFSQRLYTSYLRRFASASSITNTFWRKRSILGQVTYIGDGDGFRLFHTPGGRLAGWGWFPGRAIPRNKSSLKDNTISVRIAGIDAPEAAHFGHPAQPGGQEAWDWLKRYLTGRTVRCHVWRKDQYERAVATVYVRLWGGLVRRDVGLVMLKKGLATVYEAKSGAEFGEWEDKYRRAEFWAKWWKRGIWKDLKESPREYKERTRSEDKEKEKLKATSSVDTTATGGSDAKLKEADTSSKKMARGKKSSAKVTGS